jgi:hypothetical protein
MLTVVMLPESPAMMPTNRIAIRKQSTVLPAPVMHISATYNGNVFNPVQTFENINSTENANLIEKTKSINPNGVVNLTGTAPIPHSLLADAGTRR